MIFFEKNSVKSLLKYENILNFEITNNLFVKQNKI